MHIIKLRLAADHRGRCIAPAEWVIIGLVIIDHLAYDRAPFYRR